MQKVVMTPSRARNIGIAMGVLYAIGMRLLFEFQSFIPFMDLVTIAFLVFVPIAMGAIRVYYQVKAIPELSGWDAARISLQPVFVFLLVSVITLLEGSICVFLGFPIFMIFACVGGMIGKMIANELPKRHSRLGINAIMLLPLLIAPLENSYFTSSQTYTVTNTITINAPVNQVWSQITNVHDIDESELAYSLSELIGVPQPISAAMDGDGVGAIRTSHWQKGVVFREIITEWTPNKTLAYRFDINPDEIPDNALDPHVKIGGKHFAPLHGAYHLAPDTQGRTQLTLTTTVVDNTSLGFYSRTWGKVVFSDFHQLILKLIKTRSE